MKICFSDVVVIGRGKAKSLQPHPKFHSTGRSLNHNQLLGETERGVCRRKHRGWGQGIQTGQFQGLLSDAWIFLNAGRKPALSGAQEPVGSKHGLTNRAGPFSAPL